VLHPLNERGCALTGLLDDMLNAYQDNARNIALQLSPSLSGSVPSGGP
jgi:hypothetical protein